MNANFDLQFVICDLRSDLAPARAFLVRVLGDGSSLKFPESAWQGALCRDPSTPTPIRETVRIGGPGLALGPLRLRSGSLGLAQDDFLKH